MCILSENRNGTKKYANPVFLELFRIYSVIIRIIVAETRVIVTLIVEFRIFSILFYPGIFAPLNG